MSSTKKVRYMVSNGVDYDLYAFETTADQIKEGVLTTQAELNNGTDTQLVSAKLIKEALALKANQSDISNGLEFKGSCLYSELPESGNNVGDFYYTTDNLHYYTWNGSTWIDTGIGVGDVVSKEEYEEDKEIINNNIDELKGDLDNHLNVTSSYMNIVKAIGRVGNDGWFYAENDCIRFTCGYLAKGTNVTILSNDFYILNLFKYSDKNYDATLPYEKIPLRDNSNPIETIKYTIKEDGYYRIIIQTKQWTDVTNEQFESVELGVMLSINNLLAFDSINFNLLKENIDENYKSLHLLREILDNSISFGKWIDGTEKLMYRGVPVYNLDAYRNDRELVFEDDFNDETLDETKWYIKTGEGFNYDNLQAYTRECLSISNSNLVIRAYKDNEPIVINGENKYWKSGSIQTKPENPITYGRIEAKIKFPNVKGSSPAFWGCGLNGEPWPVCGEIDIVEHYPDRNGNLDSISSGLIYGTEANKPINLGRVRSYKLNMNGYHIYSMEWSENKIQIYVDDILISDCDISEFDNFKHGFNLILNLAIGSSGGQPENDTTEMKMYVDWVRAYK